MARKGNLPKNGSEAHTPNNRKHVSESGSEFSEKKGGAKVNKAKIGAEQEHLNGSQPSSPLAEGAGSTNHEGTEKKKGQNAEKLPRRKKQGTEKIQDPKQSVSYESNSTECAGSTSTATTEPFDLREEESRRSTNSGHGRKFQKFVPKCLPNGYQVENAMANLEVSYNVLCRNLRASTVSILKITYEWLERQKPMLVTLKSNILQARNYIGTKIEIVYPVVLRFFMYFGNIMLLLSMVWLDCTLRGIDSFLHMGTSSFFSIIWCSALSMIAMIGIFKFLLVLAIPALLGLFVGFTFSILSLAISGALLLWFYGSFWTTSLVIVFGGLAFAFSHERVALFITTGYAVYCAWIYAGWLGLLLGLNLSFISSDALIYFLKSNVNDPTRPSGPFEQTTPTPDPGVDRGPGNPSTSGVESEITSEDEVIRLLNCTDHYSALGISRFENVDASLLKREYRKKAMLVHPDKNMGNEKAAEAFKKLQNAYEVLLDSLKRRAYDDELKREELLNYFRNFQGASQQKGRHGFYPSGFTRPEAEADDPFGESRLMACTKCGNFHVWVCTKKEKSRARWCQDCKDFHPAKDGDGWVEQPSQPFFFGLLKKVEAPSAYVCAESKIYDATEWYICQGMRCPANTHKPSFHANTSVSSKHNGKGPSSSGHRNGTFEPEESMTEEEFFKWLQNAMQSGGIPGPFGASTSTENHPSARPGNSSKTSGGSASKRTKKGKKQR